MEKHIEINQAKIKGGMFCDFSYAQTLYDPARTNDISQSSDLPVHEDLVNAFAGLLPHFLIVSEVVLLAADANFEEHRESVEQSESPYSVVGFKHTDKGIVLNASKNLSTGKSMVLVTPTISREDYDHYNDLSEALMSCKNEVILYMEGKRAPDMQMQLEFEGEVDDFATDTKPKKRRKAA